MEIKENKLSTERHTTFYLSCGPEDGPLAILIHGWPDLSLGWHHQLRHLGSLGFHAIAPDMRGYGKSTIHKNKSDYCQKEIVEDMLELFNSLNAVSYTHLTLPTSR